MVFTAADQDKPKKKRKMKAPLAHQHKEYLALLSKTKKVKQRNKFIEAADESQLSAVSECVKNLLAGNIEISGKELNNLRRYKTVLRKLALRCSGKERKAERREVLKQSGGFLPMLLPLALQAVGGLVGNLFSK